MGYSRVVTSSTLDAEPACPGAADDRRRPAGTDNGSSRGHTSQQLIAVRRTFDSIDRETWDALAAANPWATPFSQWAFHRAWWDAYGATSHEETMVVVAAADASGSPIAIVPLMHRHEVEPADEAARTSIRHAPGGALTAVEPTAKAIFFGASYHADYATILTHPLDLPAVAEALVEHLAGAGDATRGSSELTGGRPMRWDAVDLRRLRCGDPAADALLAAFKRRAAGEGWHVTDEREDVCPVVTLPDGIDFEGYLGLLGKKERHEIRRKVRRAEAAGEVRLDVVADPATEIETFIDLHQKRWGADGLFPPTAGGDASRRFFEQLARWFGADGALRIGRLMVAGRLVAEGVHFDDGEVLYYYNAGVDPDARELSPGVLMAARYMELAVALGRRRVDFLRGDESYKYEWGAVDEPIRRILVTRVEGVS
jgi:CelD/BcsL family acetyltransferase involved in cellulose biosynthesis